MQRCRRNAWRLWESEDKAVKLDITVPSVGESVTQGILATWLKADGDTVSEGSDLFELETDKATVTVPAPASGILSISVKAGGEVTIGQVVGAIMPSAKPAPELAAAPSAVRPAPVSPPLPRAPAPPTPARVTSELETGPEVLSGERRVPMTSLRKRIAERLVQAQHASASLTTFNEVNMQKVSDLRVRYKDEFEKAHGVKLGFMSFFVKASCLALAEMPVVNARIEGDEIVYSSDSDIGVAVSTERGLVVPVLRRADGLSLAEIELAIADLAARARDRKILPDELSGGTFSITNGGVFGSLLSTPLLNYPQSAILGMHTIQRRPVAEQTPDGKSEQVVVRPMMYVALTYDHRLIDGRDAVGFLRRVKELVEDPWRLFIEA
jgi:2-oxoglutarate dehydrogenase E2 component (dihydrolipoamide succinyltransferase)